MAAAVAPAAPLRRGSGLGRAHAGGYRAARGSRRRPVRRRPAQGHRAHAGLLAPYERRSRTRPSMPARTRSSAITPTSCAVSNSTGAPDLPRTGQRLRRDARLSPDQSHPKRAAWARRRRELFGFEPDPAYISRRSIPKRSTACWRAGGGRSQARCGRFCAGVGISSPLAGPVLATGQQAAAVCRYVAQITQAAGSCRR